MFHRLRRRMSPATALAGTALFVALGGTAVAQSGIIVHTPDELASNVVTGPKIASNAVGTNDVFNESISDVDLRDPQLKVRVISSGATLPDSNGTAVRTSTGNYNVTFNVSTLNANGGGTFDNLLNNNCAFSAVARNQTSIMAVDGPVAGAPNTVHVRATFPDPDGLLRAVDSQFDLLASC